MAMTNLFVRAAAFAVLAMILLAVLSVVVFLVVLGMPGGANALATFQTEAAKMAPQVDLILGGLIMLGCGWLAGRAYAGGDALRVAALMAVIYIALDVAIVFVFGDVSAMAVGTTGLSYAVKTVAALIGGFVAGRTPAAAEPASGG
jgi:hypothetical protein